MVSHPEFIDKLPGPITLIMTKKGQMLDAAAAGLTLGVRIPDHPIVKLVEKAGVPLITTSANKSGQSPATNAKEIPRELERMVDFVIDGGQVGGKPSKIVDLTGPSPVVIRE
jgi:tRNA threonylcarbamoyl adenosine modification protein (Sua5/YciO/YrdC/YwlC family)